MDAKTYANVTVPNPETANPKEVITFIDLFEVGIVGQVYDQLVGLKYEISADLTGVFQEKITKGYILKTDWMWRISAESYQRKKEELDLYADQYWFELKGVHIRRYRKALDECMLYEKVWLENDRRNRYDSNAIKVVGVAGIIGHVPANETEEVAAILAQDHRAFIHTIIEIDGYLDVSIIVHYNKSDGAKKAEL